MTQYADALDRPLMQAAPDYQRLDLRRRDIVEHAISVQQASNTVSAIEYLKSHDIDPELIERILLEPGRRRKAH